MNLIVLCFEQVLGLTLDTDETNLALLYLATIQALAVIIRVLSTMVLEFRRLNFSSPHHRFGDVVFSMAQSIFRKRWSEITATKK